MPCKVDMTPRASERERLNRDARFLRLWLENRLRDADAKEELDDTGKLCALIRELGESQFVELCVEHIRESQARLILGWWEQHKEYDQKWGRN